MGNYFSKGCEVYEQVRSLEEQELLLISIVVEIDQR